MMIRVLTLDLSTDRPESLRQIDMAVLEQRKWLNSHSSWAWHNQRAVQTWAAGTPEDEQKVAVLTETWGPLPRDPRQS